MKRHILSPADRDELSRLLTEVDSTDGLQRFVTRISQLPPSTIHEIERMTAQVWPTRWRLHLAPHHIADIHPLNAPVLMFNGDGYVREAALKAMDPLPDAPFFLAALVWRLNDWVEQVRSAAEECVRRELPRLSASTIVGAALFLLERMLEWGRWRSPPRAVLDLLTRPGCADALAARFLETPDVPTRIVRGALRLGLLDDHLLALSRTALRPGIRAIALKALLDGEVTWIARHERQWTDKRYGQTRRVPVLGRRAVTRPVPLDVLIRQGATDRSVPVRRTAASFLAEHAARLGDIKPLMDLFDGEKNPSVRWYIAYLAERGEAAPQGGSER